MGGLGSNGIDPSLYVKNSEAIEKLFEAISEIGEAASNNKVSAKAFAEMSQVFKELGSNLSKAKGASETIMFVKNQLANPNVEAIVGIEERIVDTLRGGHHEYDVVVKLKESTLQKIEIKAWDPKPKGVYNPNYMGERIWGSR